MSTTEVESVVSKAGNLLDCVVYGVQVLFFVISSEQVKSYNITNPTFIVIVFSSLMLFEAILNLQLEGEQQ